MRRIGWTSVGTPIGELAVFVSDQGVVATAFDLEREALVEDLADRYDVVARTPRSLASVRRDVAGYFRGVVRAFATPPDLTALPAGFGRRVLEVTAGIPFGELWTYGDVAQMAGSARGGRAAGNALRTCPMELFVPCHRVVHAGGSLGGYGRHDERKRWLIEHERAA